MSPETGIGLIAYDSPCPCCGVLVDVHIANLPHSAVERDISIRLTHCDHTYAQHPDHVDRWKCAKCGRVVMKEVSP